MLILILGVALWWAAHLFKRAAPETRAKLGDPGKGGVAIALVLSIVLMTIGYKMAVGAFFWGPAPATVGINNLLVLLAFYMFAASGMKTRVTKYTRHPMLWGFVLWALAHLLVNGDTPSFILFGGLLIWALVEMQVINRVSDHVPPTGPFPVKKEIMAAAGAVIVMLVVGTIHALVGPSPFGVS
ncbi:NnrU family protein [Paracoccus sp. 1_MG-2023]|uniref:NnrU family protein n=1 Tax=unclassified Paracoccus (in: a-proteobacteria) TaxID=2688777 RepID=UPI001C09A7FE|nr:MULTISPECIES: NnrU family protein [unclassified Paracoccus (in: a-proteobacteria)]MBU2958535.1 NnrU family protein [Paracoccus sp. C2R09]MDO6668480.1 NnrU family protein [Paracoccus sp. 1_MG-2023]